MRVIIICEGATEKQFCDQVLSPYLSNKEIYINCPKIGKNGGNVSWGRLKNDIKLYLKNDPSAYISTFIDLYGLTQPSEFPKWNDALLLKNNPYDRVKMLEEGIKNSFSEEDNYRLVPYIALYEFEGLLFNNLKAFEVLDGLTTTMKQSFQHILTQYPNPELINENPNTAPSKRLTSIYPRYNKVIQGAILANEIGLQKIRAKAPHFDNWINRLENLISWHS